MVRSLVFLCFSQAQFIFLHDTILEHAQCGNTLVQVPQLSKMIQMLDTIDPDTGKTGFCKQYQVTGSINLAIVPKIQVYLLTLNTIGDSESDTEDLTIQM